MPLAWAAGWQYSPPAWFSNAHPSWPSLPAALLSGALYQRRRIATAGRVFFIHRFSITIARIHSRMAQRAGIEPARLSGRRPGLAPLLPPHMAAMDGWHSPCPCNEPAACPRLSGVPAVNFVSPVGGRYSPLRVAGTGGRIRPHNLRYEAVFSLNYARTCPPCTCHPAIHGDVTPRGTQPFDKAGCAGLSRLSPILLRPLFLQTVLMWNTSALKTTFSVRAAWPP